MKNNFETIFPSCLAVFFAVFLFLLVDARKWKLHLIDLEQYPMATCLDGTPGGFWFQQGEGSGAHNFLIHHQGGGWCISEHDCFRRSTSTLGSSRYWREEMDCDHASEHSGHKRGQPCVVDGSGGLRSSNAVINPITHNWNKIYLGYCDGASFSGNVFHPVKYKSRSSQANLYFRGKYILEAIYSMLFSGDSTFGMEAAEQILIAGTSAGAVSVLVQSNHLLSLIRSKHHFYRTPKSLQQKSLAENIKEPRVLFVLDAGIFLNVLSIDHKSLYPRHFQEVFQLQNLSTSLDSTCLNHYQQQNEPWKCFLAQYMLPFMKAKEVFVVNSLVDHWAASNIMGIRSCTPYSPATHGTNKPGNPCSEKVIRYLNQYRLNTLGDPGIRSFLETKTSAASSERNYGAWLCTCWTHVLVNSPHYWSNVQVQNQTLQAVIRNWYYRNATTAPVVIDQEWGLNPC